ncbi:hypothetical protein KBC54_03745 [Patescibacteria group bacterium]|nr:hypothetical protein [Patescibacteria group bacterium]
MPPSPTPKQTLPVATKTSVSTRLAVGIAIGFIAGALGGSYGFALLSNRIAQPSPMVGGAPNQAANNAAAVYGGNAANANNAGLVGGNAANANNPAVVSGNAQAVSGSNPSAPNPTFTKLCQDGKTVPASSGACLCPNGLIMPTNGVCGGTTGTGTPETPCPTDMKMGSDGMCHPIATVPCLDKCALDLKACAATGASVQICTLKLATCTNLCQPKTKIPRCPDGTVMPASGVCPTPGVPCLTLCNNAYTKCAYSGTGSAATQQNICLSQLNVCTNQCTQATTPTTPTTPTGGTGTSGTGGTTTPSPTTTCPTGKVMTSSGICQ